MFLCGGQKRILQWPELIQIGRSPFQRAEQWRATVQQIRLMAFCLRVLPRRRTQVSTSAWAINGSDPASEPASSITAANSPCSRCRPARRAGSVIARRSSLSLMGPTRTWLLLILPASQGTWAQAL